MQPPENPNNSENNDMSKPMDGDETKIPGMSSDATVQTTAVDNAAPTLEQQLKEAETKAAEHYDAWVRAKAETENIRKRAQTDVTNAHKYAIENFPMPYWM